MESMTLAHIETALVDDVVIGAMTLLVEGSHCAVSPAMPARFDDITVAVYCDRNQQSAVVLRCSHALAMMVTGKMLELEQNEITSADMLDATGELVNVIAGNLRGLVTSPGTMTAPFLLEPGAFSELKKNAANAFTLTGEGMQLFRM